MRIGSVVRAGVVAACLTPCLTAGLLAARSGPPEKACRIEPEEEILEPASIERKSGALAIVRMGYRSVALVADTDAQEIVAFDTRSAKVMARMAVGGSPSHVLVAATATGERHLYVTQRDSNTVKAFDVRPRGIACGGEHEPLLRPVAEMKTADEPVAMAVTPNGETLLVLAGWGHALEGFSTQGHDKVFDASVPREPRAVIVDAGGTRAFVSHAVGSSLTIVNLRPEHATRTIKLEGTVGPVIDSRDGSVDGRPPFWKSIFGLSSDASFGLFDGDDSFGLGASNLGASDPPPRPPGPRSAVQGFALASLRIASGAERILLPEVLVDPGEMPVVTAQASRPTGYGPESPGVERRFAPAVAHVAVIEARSETVLPTSMTLAIDDTSCLLPRAAAIDPSRRTLLVACLGTDEIDEYDAMAPNPTFSLHGRWKVPSGPTGIAVDEERLVVWSSFDRVLTVIGRGGDLAHASTMAPRAPTPFEVGRKIFHASGNPAISADGRVCASCHPDGRDDGLTWSSPDGPRQTPMLAGRLADSAPFGWTGGSPTVRLHLHQTLRRLHGGGLDDRATYALLTYLAQMKTPHRTPKGDPSKVARGGAVFRSYEAGCATCHVAGGRPIGDGDTHDVGSAAKGDLFASLGTPSLQFVGGTGPYFHDGRYATLPELLRATDGKMGSTSHLDAADFDALTTYLESL